MKQAVYTDAEHEAALIKLNNRLMYGPEDKLLREDKSSKPDFTYLGDMYPAIVRVLSRFQMGEKKYARRNWLNCKPEQILTYEQSAVRHLMQYINGQAGEDHLAAAAANILILLDLEEKK